MHVVSTSIDHRARTWKTVSALWFTRTGEGHRQTDRTVVESWEQVGRQSFFAPVPTDVNVFRCAAVLTVRCAALLSVDRGRVDITVSVSLRSESRFSSCRAASTESRVQW